MYVCGNLQPYCLSWIHPIPNAGLGCRWKTLYHPLTSYWKFLECCWRQRCAIYPEGQIDEPRVSLQREWRPHISESCGEWLEDDVVFFHFVEVIKLYWNSTVLYSEFCRPLNWSLLLLQELLWQSWLPSTKCCWLWKDYEEGLSKHEGTSSGHERQIEISFTRVIFSNV